MRDVLERPPVESFSYEIDEAQYGRRKCLFVFAHRLRIKRGRAKTLPH